MPSATGQAAARLRLSQPSRWLPRSDCGPSCPASCAASRFRCSCASGSRSLGPTYIKLGQILSLREDLLPRAITDELKNLLNRLPAVSYERFVELARRADRPAVAGGVLVGRPEVPLGSASIGSDPPRRDACSGDTVILKIVKPGIRETLRRDVDPAAMFGWLLQLFLGRFQPRRVIREFCDYTLREIDLRLEADNAETFAANFKDSPTSSSPPSTASSSREPAYCAWSTWTGMKPRRGPGQPCRCEDRDLASWTSVPGDHPHALPRRLLPRGSAPGATC